MSGPRGARLPRSGVGVDGPWLVIEPPGASIRVDLRQLDDVELEDDAAREATNTEGASEAGERGGSILLTRGELVVALYIADGRSAAGEIVREAKEWVGGKAGPAEREAVAFEESGPPVVERFVIVGGEPVLVDGPRLRVGDLAFRLSDVHRYARRGANIPLHDGASVQAAVTLLVAVAVGWDGLDEPWLGIEFVRDERRVEHVDPESPAADAGVRVGDEVIAIGAVSAVLQPEIGDHVALRLVRGAEQLHVAFSAASDLPEQLNVKAPAFSATTVRGDQLSLADLAGHVVVLEFWKPSDEVSRGKVPHLVALHAKYSDLRIVAISPDAPEMDAQIAYPLIHDKHGSILEAYDAIEPTLVVIDREGIVRKLEYGVPDFERLEAELSTLRA